MPQAKSVWELVEEEIRKPNGIAILSKVPATAPTPINKAKTAIWTVPRVRNCFSMLGL
ncbi:MAG: hypothetical protein QW750_08105 [Zestosphaera sp.]